MTREDARLVSNGLLIAAGAALLVVVGREVARRPRWLRVARRTLWRTAWRTAPALLFGVTPARLAAVAVAAALDAVAADPAGSASTPTPAPAPRGSNAPATGAIPQA
jgi:hypothetical protein